MDIKSNEKTVELLTRLKKAHNVYKVLDEKDKAVLFDNCKFIFDGLVESGYDRTFVETLLIGGGDFLESWFQQVKGTDQELSSYEAGLVIFK